LLWKAFRFSGRIAELLLEDKMKIESLGDLPGRHEVKRGTLAAPRLWQNRSMLDVLSGHSLSLDRLDQYHGAATLVLDASALGMMASLCLGLGPLWAGFLAGALPTFLLASLVHPEHSSHIDDEEHVPNARRTRPVDHA
jgi:hypothetical protein